MSLLIYFIFIFIIFIFIFMSLWILWVFTIEPLEYYWQDVSRAFTSVSKQKRTESKHLSPSDYRPTVSNKLLPYPLQTITASKTWDVTESVFNSRTSTRHWVLLLSSLPFNGRTFSTTWQNCCIRHKQTLWRDSIFTCLLSIVAFKTLDISQGSVATHLRCGGIFGESIITNFLLILKVK